MPNEKIRQSSLEAVEVISDLLRGKPDIAAFSIDGVMKMTNGAWVFRATINGHDAVLKRYLRRNAAAVVMAAKRELDHLERIFGSGHLQANRCLFAYPESGLIALSYAPGSRLDKKIMRSYGPWRLKLITRSGQWLRRYSEERQQISPMAPRRWVEKLEAKSTHHVTDPKDRRLLADLLAKLHGQIGTLRGAPMLRGASHGDFVGMNAHVHRGTIVGVDIQGEHWTPIARETACFLVWQQIHDRRLRGGLTFGLRSRDLAAFLSSGVLPAVEHKSTLPFFIGEQLYLRALIHYQGKSGRACMEAIGAYCSYDA